MADNKWNGGNPWMGLAPYTEGTTLYGRSEECLVLSEIIKNSIASIVFGKSGIGKSSLLSAGISPLLRDENYIPIRIRLVHNTDVSYVEQIKRAIRENIICEDQLRTSFPEFGLWDFFHRHIFSSTNGDMCIPVIILDQFEEIYTLTDSEHKNPIIEFFSEVSSLLNDIKSDAVVEYEKTHSTLETGKEETANAKGLILKRSNGNTLKYIPENNFRFVVCLREDKLYLLERNSVNIPSFKTNRYNLHALSPQSAIEVIMCPRPDLFSNEEAMVIVDKIADMGEEGIRTIDPAILSLFLYKYFEKQGATNYDNIFTEYYRESTEGIKTKSIAFLENHLLTLGGYRNQIPLDDAIESGVSRSDIKQLLEKVILRTEKRKDIDYIEFSHDRLCEEAKRSRDERNITLQKRVARKRMMIGGCIIIVLFLAVLLFASKNKELNKAQNDLQDKIGLIERQNASLDSLIGEKNKINKNLESEIRIGLIKSDSLKYLLNRIGFINKQILVANDSMQRLLADNLRLDKENRAKDEKLLFFQNQQSNSDTQTDIHALQAIRIKSAANEAITRSMLETANEDCSVKGLMQKFYAICYMILNDPTFSVKDIDKLRRKYTYFSSLRSTMSNEEYSYNGHMVFDYEFLSDLRKKGKDVYQQSDSYERNTHTHGQIPSNSILVRTCYVKANSMATYTFVSRGSQELAVVAEPGGLLLLKVHVTNADGYDKWYGDESNNKSGEAFKYIAFHGPNNIRNKVAIEVTNCINKDITFAVISN